MTDWKNRIIETAEMKVSALKANPKNWRKHPKAQADALAGVLDTVGWVAPVIYNRQTDRLVDGHLRLDLAIKRKEKTLPVSVVDLSPEEEAMILATFDPIAAMAEADKQMLQGLMESIETEDEQIQALLESIAREEKIDLGGEPAEAPEPQVDRAAELAEQWQTARGQLWQCGDHRVLCGDSTNAADVARLMCGETGEIVFTSPPYNAGNSSTGGYGGNPNRSAKGMYNSDFDSMSKDQYFGFLMSVLGELSDVVGDSAPVLWNVAYNAKSRDDYGRIVFSAANPFTVKETIIWDKGLGMNVAARGILSRTGGLIFLMSKGADYTTNQGPKDTYWNLWRISNRDGDNMGNSHGASFPVALPAEGLKLFSSPGALCVDPFLGSGTTLIACEQLGRRCFGLEISPAYVAVILQRWHDMTGRDPVLLET